MKIAKVVGLNSDFETAQVLITSQASAQAIFLVNCSLDDAFTRARHALSEAENSFSLSAETNLSSKVKESFEALINDLTDAKTLSCLVVGIEENPNAKKLLYLQNIGDGLFCNLIRATDEIDLTKISPPGELVSGLLEIDDKIIAGTESLKEILKTDFKNLARLPSDNFEDEVQAHLLGFQVLPLAAVMLEEEKELEEGRGVTDNFPRPVIPKESRLNFKIPKLVSLKRIVGAGQKIVPRSKRGLLALGVFLLVVVISGTLLTLRTQRDIKSQDQFNSLFTEASADFDQAIGLKELNPPEANTKLKQAADKLDQALKLSPKDSKALELQKKIAENSDFILKIYNLSELPVWLDLNLIKKDFTTTRLSYSLGGILVYDSAKSSLVLINTETKSFEILSGGEKLAGGGPASLNGNLAFVLTNQGVVKVDSTLENSTLVIKTDEDWGEIKDLLGFAGNVYLLDRLTPQIWKYLPVEAGYSDKRSYLKEGTQADFLTALKLQIDSSVWILKEGGEILKYTAGVRDYFGLSGLDKDLSDPKTFFVSENGDNIYILDSGNNRLVVVNKSGIYHSQYRSESLGGVEDLVVDEEKKQAYLLKESKIYLLELK